MSSSNGRQWQMTRLRRTTVKLLMSLVEGLDRGLERGTNKLYIGDPDRGWTADRIISVLLAREFRKRARAKRSRLRASQEVTMMRFDQDIPAGFVDLTEEERVRWEDDGGNGGV